MAEPINTAPDAAGAELRALMIVPDGGINPRMGGGQRSVICFNALKALGPVDVVILGEDQGKDASVFFPGAASVRWVPSTRFPARQKAGLDWLRYNARRFLFINRLYRPEPQAVAALSQILTPAHRVVLCRYVLPFCVVGVTAGRGRTVCVDIDDRDDQKFLSASQAVLGTGRIGRMFAGMIVPAVRRQLETRLKGASLLWYATPEDDMDIAGPHSAVLRNVPFDVASPEHAPAPSENRDVLFVGSYAHRPNQDGIRWFLRNCWADLSKRQPQARLRIVGLGPWQDLAAEFADLERVDYVGTVQDIAAEYLRARIVISPIFDGGGSKIKVIEACAYGRPVVAATHSTRGFSADLEQALPCADTAQSYIETCAGLLHDDGAVDTLARQLQHIQQAQFSQAATQAQIVRDIRKVLG